MDLIDPKTRETFICPQGWPSNRRRKALARIDEMQQAEGAEIAKKFPTAAKAAQLPAEERNRMLGESPELRIEMTGYANALADMTATTALRCCQATLDPSGLPAERRAMIESDPEGEFWQEQELPAVEEAVRLFRRSYQPGRRGDRVDPELAGTAYETSGQTPGGTAGNAGSTSPATEVGA